MFNAIERILSHECGAFWQVVKYGIIGVLSTAVQTAAFYILASTFFKCLKSDDWAVKLFKLSPCDVSDALRARRFAVATAIGFVAANLFCWQMNRLFVFEPGLYSWYVELGMFFASSAASVAIALAISCALIKYMSMMTTFAVAIEIIASFAINFAVRKFFIFKG